MDKKRYLKIILLFLLVVSCNYQKGKSIDDNEPNIEFEYIGSFTDTLVTGNYRDPLGDVDYAGGVDPYGVYNKKNGIVSTPQLAYIVAKAILVSEYGKKQIEEELPLQVSLINNRFWVIQGKLKANTLGGVATIVIKKDDGQVQYIGHSK